MVRHPGIRPPSSSSPDQRVRLRAAHRRAPAPSVAEQPSPPSSGSSTFLSSLLPRSSDALNRLGHRLLERAPARRNAVRGAMEHRFDAADQAVLDLEQLAKLPCPVDVVVIKEGEREDDAAFAVD